MPAPLSCCMTESITLCCACSCIHCSSWPAAALVLLAGCIMAGVNGLIWLVDCVLKRRLQSSLTPAVGPANAANAEVQGFPSPLRLLVKLNSVTCFASFPGCLACLLLYRAFLAPFDRSDSSTFKDPKILLVIMSDSGGGGGGSSSNSNSMDEPAASPGSSNAAARLCR